MKTILPVLSSAITIMIPVLFAAAGGLFPALSGTLNIALEGLLLIGAFSSLAVFYFSGSVAASILAAALAAVSLAALHAFSVFRLRANVFITGLAVNLFSSGLCIVLSDKIFNTRGVVAAAGAAGLKIPYFYSAVLLLLIISVVINKTPFGLRLRACDKNADALISLGINPVFYRKSAILISGVFAGIGGSFLSLSLGAFVPGMSAGKGWIALVVIFLGRHKPLGILAAVFVFSLAESFSNYSQGLWKIPADFILALPYIVTFVAMIILSIISKLKTS